MLNRLVFPGVVYGAMPILYDWSEFPSFVHGIQPMPHDYLVSTSEGIYHVRGCAGPFVIEDPPVRLWMARIDAARLRIERCHVSHQ
jgi:hypothetical protein